MRRFSPALLRAAIGFKAKAFPGICGQVCAEARGALHFPCKTRPFPALPFFWAGWQHDVFSREILFM
jgi:hypothetical protein